MTPITEARMHEVRGGDCAGLHRLAVVALLLGQGEIALAAELTAILEGCEV